MTNLLDVRGPGLPEAEPVHSASPADLVGTRTAFPAPAPFSAETVETIREGIMLAASTFYPHHHWVWTKDGPWCPDCGRHYDHATAECFGLDRVLCTVCGQRPASHTEWGYAVCAECRNGGRI